MSWFEKHEEVRSFPNKVNKIVRKEFNESNFNALKKQITDFRKSSEYRDKLKDCSKLSTIISANLVKLSDYKKIEEAYKNLKREDKRRWNVVFSIGDYKDYAWYHKEVVRLETLLQKRKEDIDLLEKEIEQLRLVLDTHDYYHPKVTEANNAIRILMDEINALNSKEYRSW